jgi:hypothetical protein
VLVAAGLTAVALSGCGSGRSAQVVSATAAAQMRGHLAELRTAAAAHDPAGAARQLDAFAADVGREQAAGRLRQNDYAALQTAIARTRARIAAEVVAPAPVTTVTVPTAAAAPVPAAAPAGPAKGKAHPQDHAQGTGNGKAKGNGKGKGGD